MFTHNIVYLIYFYFIKSCILNISALYYNPSLGRVCIGTSSRMSAPSNRDHHYRNLRDRYTNCTYVDGNLELTWLEDVSLNLNFLKDIREVTGYVLISHVYIHKTVLPNLQIIRGRSLFSVQNETETYALFVTQSGMLTLELPALREILEGSVAFLQNFNLCHVKDIIWEDIISENAVFRYSHYFETIERTCEACDRSCTQVDGKPRCWGQGRENCQKFSKTNCSPQCASTRCFGTLPRECCHSFCAGGCTGPTKKDCYACKNFYDDGVCKEECPPMQKYNPSNYLLEPNPDGKYAYGATCVRKCPDHLLKDTGACVRKCPPHKMEVNGECVPCNGPCPKTCSVLTTLNSGNIDSFIGCTVLEGSIEILQSSFTGYTIFDPNSRIMGDRIEAMHPNRLEAFSSLKEVTGYINIQGNHKDFVNLSYFRNLEVIGGRQTYGNPSASIYIIKTSLKSLGLKSLKRINSGSVFIVENDNLCLVDDIAWITLMKNNSKLAIHKNQDDLKCVNDGFICSEECSNYGCWDIGPDQCLQCQNVKYNGTCLKSCSELPNIYKIDSKTCTECHPECKDSCHGAKNDECESCRNVMDGIFCVHECPPHKYNDNGFCQPCHESCITCTGPRNTIGSDGCTSCHIAIMNEDNEIEKCLLENEVCPEEYYSQGITQQFINGTKELAAMLGKPLCRKCHPRCAQCTGYGFNNAVCQKCKNYRDSEQCMDECAPNQYTDESEKRCLSCHDECQSCVGPHGPHECIKCRHVKVFYEDQKFLCQESCPPEQKYKIIPNDDSGPYCWHEPEKREHNELFGSLAFIISGVFLGCLIILIISCVLYQKTKAARNAAKMTQALIGEDSVPLKPTNVGPNLTKLRIIKEAELRRGGVLGMGAFGRVHKGIWIPENESLKIPVAIKVLIDISGAESSKEFLEEAYIMASVEHPNLLKLLAVCMTHELMLITQLMPLGCLLDYVRKNKTEIGSKAFLDWSCQIAKGMQYLEENRLVHRDLAARNVLVQSPSHVKITDFGLAKLLDFDSDEYKATGGKMPIKWLALECIRHRIFTSKSDVWAFGVTIWELLTYGSRPYPDVEAKDLVNVLERGQKLPQPKICTLDIYMILLSCWLIDANARPTFKQLFDKFSEMSSDPGRYLVIEGDKFLKLPAYTSKDEKDLIRKLANEQVEQEAKCCPSQEYLQPQTTPLNNDSSDASNRAEVSVGSLKLDLPLDNEDYLMPSFQSNNEKATVESAAGYMDLIPDSPTAAENPEYMLGVKSYSSYSNPNDSEQSSDQECLNDSQHECQPLRSLNNKML